eukprot:1523590-Prymnesium_polylepis.1
MSQDCRALALSHEKPVSIFNSTDANYSTALHLPTAERRQGKKEKAESLATAIQGTDGWNPLPPVCQKLTKAQLGL